MEKEFLPTNVYNKNMNCINILHLHPVCSYYTIYFFSIELVIFISKIYPSQYGLIVKKYKYYVNKRYPHFIKNYLISF